MAARIIDGKAIAAGIRAEAARDTAALLAERGAAPGLAFLLVGDNPASQSYVRSKEKACAECGMRSVTERLPADATQEQVLRQVAAWNADPSLHGILVQLPLPRHIDEHAVIEAIDPRKDVDGFHPINVGRLLIGEPCLRPCTPAGVHELLLRSGIETAGKHAVVVGRSLIVGKPVAAILMQKQAGANAIVTVVHTAAPDPERYTRQADIIVAASGRPRWITADMVKEGVVVIDVGINEIPDPSSPKGRRLVGDVDFEAVREKASAITPVPGGVGPMTIAMLMRNTLQAARALLG